MTKLHIAPGLSLPKQAITQTFGILAVRGVGKTYLEMVMAEEFLKNDLPIVAIDSMGAFWGLRAGADGKPSGGYPILIMGGEHGDVPLVPTAGKVVADLVVNESLSCVLDISDFRKGEQKRFVKDFAEELYHKKARKKDPLHLILDEADLWAPQKPWKGDEQLLGAIEDIVRRGRQRGLGVTMATQRPAVLNKNILSQISVLVAMQIVSPHDIEAIDTWVKSNGTKEKREEVVGSLASLEIGEAWVWSPAWLKVFKRIKVRKRFTFDSSKTPEVGEKVRAPKKLARVELEKIEAMIAQTVEQVESDNPRILKRKIFELQLALRKEKDKKQEVRVEKSITKTKTKVVEKPVLRKGEVSRLEAAIKSAVQAKTSLEKVSGELGERVDRLVKAAEKLTKPKPKEEFIIPKPDPKVMRRGLEAWKPPIITREMRSRQREDNGKPMVAGERRMVCALGYFHPRTITRSQIALLIGLRAKGTTFTTYISGIKRRGYARESGGLVSLTEEGLTRVEETTLPRTAEEFQAMWRSKLVAGERKIFDALLKVHPNGLARGELGGIVSIIPEGTTMTTYLGTLRRNGLVSKEGGTFFAHEDLFMAANAV